MFFVRRVLVFLMIASGGLVFSQAPEFTQQYLQRLGGAIDELTVIIQDFDEQANHAGLDRQAALNVYALSQQDFLRSQGDAMRRHFDRYQALSDQAEHLVASPAILRPMVIARHADPRILSSAFADFSPAVPVSVAGLVWAAIGMVCGLVLGMFLRSVFGLLTSTGSRGVRRSPTTAV